MATAQFDPQRKQMFVMRPDGSREYHEVPKGFELDAFGTPKRIQLRVCRNLHHDGNAYAAGQIVDAGTVWDVWERLVDRGVLARAEDAPEWPVRRTPPPPGEPRLSIVIAVHNQWAYTQGCLESLRAEAPDAEVVVVDNGSTDETRAGLARFPSVRVVRFPENRGVAPAWNAGLRETTGSLLCVLNNDTTIRPGGMRRLAEAAWETGIAAFQGGRLDEGLRFIGYETRGSEADYPDGCCLLVRRDVWERVGEFDEGFAPAYCEDTDWGLRARAAGFGWEVVPDTIHHYGQRTSESLEGMRDYQRRNQARLRERWAGKGLGERVRVRRWGAMGDVVAVTPALFALRQKWPLARVHLECAPHITPLLQGTADADLVGPQGVGAYTKQINLDCSYEAEQRRGRWRPAAELYAELIGVELPRIAWRLPEPVELSEWAEGLLPAGPRYLACGLRSALRPMANWGEAGWSRLAGLLPGWTLVLLDPERQPNLEARREREASGTLWRRRNVVDLTGQTPSARHAYALMRRCAACASVESGTHYLASAAGLPVVILYGGTHPDGRGPLAGPVRQVRGRSACWPCGATGSHCRAASGHCLDAVKADEVAAALKELVE